MPGVLRSVPVTDEQRQAHDRHRPLVALTVLAVLAAYIYLLTDMASSLGLPTPQDLAQAVGLSLQHVFGRDGNVQSSISISYTRRFGHDDERLIYLLLLAAAFLSAYILPLRYKQGSLVLWSVAAIVVLYGVPAAAGLLLAHTVVYLTHHPCRSQRLPWLSAAVGWLGYLAFVPRNTSLVWYLLLFAGLPAASLLAYRFIVLPLLSRPRCAVLLQVLLVQSALISVLLGVMIDAVSGREVALPLGILLFFWQWMRVIMYHLDYKDGLVPERLPLLRYLAVFLSPGVIPVWQWGLAVGQGYSYLNNNFMCEDKNKLALSGSRLLLLALMYVVFWNSAHHMLVELCSALGFSVHGGFTSNMVASYMRGEPIGTLSVLLTTMLDLAGWILLWAGVFHFKVGVWRICGYRVDPEFNRPWAATNLVQLWPRISFHYREFLVRACYYPVFFRFLKGRHALRIVTATMAAAALGNLVWGHIVERMLYAGIRYENLWIELGTWPYFVLLGGGISLTGLYLYWRRRSRRPWSWGPGLALDVLAAYGTLQFFTLIRIFRRPAGGSAVGDLFLLFLKGFGVHV